MADFQPNDGVPKGHRFDQVYISRTQPLRDSAKMRFRIAAIMRNMPTGFDRVAEEEMGLRSPYSSSKGWVAFLAEWDIKDVLSLITVAIQFHRSRGGHTVAAGLVSVVAKIFTEENVGYAIDSEGGVHPFVDPEFANTRAAAIAALSSTRHANVLNEFEAGTDSIGKDNKIAIIRTFMAAEGLFRLISDTSPRLVAGEVDKLLPHMKGRFQEDAIAERVSIKILASFKDWIDACHFYRHEQAQEEIAQPSIDLTVFLISQGASFIRLLAELDALA